jgi:lysozyme family protein
MAKFNEAHELTKGNEGGWNHVKGDTGGETYCGISRVNWPAWKGWAIVDSKKPLKHNQIIKDDLLKNLVNVFYKKNFWDKMELDECPSQDLANQKYDFAVNAGIGAAKKLIKKI